MSTTDSAPEITQADSLIQPNIHPDQGNQDTTQFDIKLATEVPQDLIDGAKKSIELVLRRYIENLTTIKMEFGIMIVYSEGEDYGTDALYEPETDTFKFGIEGIKKLDLGILTDEQKIILLGSHEAMHKVQIQKGENPRASKEMTRDEHHESPHEIEAWNEAMHVFRYFYPDVSIFINQGSQHYESPEVSKYS